MNETYSSSPEAEVVTLDKRTVGGDVVTMLYFSGLIGTMFGGKEKIMALIAGTGEVSLTAANIMENCKDASSGKAIDAAECLSEVQLGLDSQLTQYVGRETENERSIINWVIANYIISIDENDGRTNQQESNKRIF